MDGFGGTGFGSFGGSFGSSSRNKLDLNDPVVLQQILDSVGKPKAKPKANALEWLLALPGAVGSIPDAIFDSKKNNSNFLKEYLNNLGEGVGTTFLRKKYDDKREGTADLLKDAGILKGDDIGSKIARGALGFGGDVLLDPLTYLTFGASSVAKKAGEKVAQEASQNVVKRILAGNTDDVVKIFGKEVISNPTAVQALKYVTNPIGSIAGAGFRGFQVANPEAAGAVQDGFDKLFRRGKAERRLLGDEAVDIIDQGRNTVRSNDLIAAGNTADLVNRAKSLTPEAQRAVLDLVEGGAGTPFSPQYLEQQGIPRLVQDLIDRGTSQGQQLVDKGILSNLNENYLSRVGGYKGATEDYIKSQFPDQFDQILGNKDIKKAIEKNGVIPFEVLDSVVRGVGFNPPSTSGIRTPIKSLGDAAKERTFDTIKQAEAAGLRFDYSKLPELVQGQEKRFLDATANADFFDQLPDILRAADGQPLAARVKDLQASGQEIPIGWQRLPGPSGKVANDANAIVVDKKALDAIKGLAPQFFGDEATNSLIKGLDKTTNFLKASMTGRGPGFLGFQTRNAIDDTLRMTADGFRNRGNAFGRANEVLKYADEVTKNGFEAANQKFGKEVQEVFDQILKHDVIGSSQFVDEVGGKATSKVGKVLDKVTMAKTFQKRENLGRIANFLDQHARTGDWAEAAKKNALTMFDYSNLTPFEQNVLRRIIPFYSFQRQNAERILTNLDKNPGVLLNQKALVDNIGKAASDSDVSEEDKSVLPDWMKNGPFAVLNKGAGNVGVLTGLGDSLSAFGNTFSTDPKKQGENILNLLSPLLNIPLEQATGKDFFRGGDINKRVPGERYKNLPDEVKEMIGYHEVEREITDKETGKKKKIKDITIDGQAAYWLANVPVLSSLMTQGKRVAGTKEDPTNILTLLSGVRYYDKNTDVERDRRQKELSQELQQVLIDAGIGKQYENFYLPKEELTPEQRAMILSSVGK